MVEGKRKFRILISLPLILTLLAAMKINREDTVKHEGTRRKKNLCNLSNPRNLRFLLFHRLRVKSRHHEELP
jgi:hypothetical protein